MGITVALSVGTLVPAAWAQIPTVSPSGAARAPAPAPPPAAAPAAAPSGVAEGKVEGKEEAGFYYSDEKPEEEKEEGLPFAGTVPEFHVVRQGDTLWDLCTYFFNNPWDWPRVWSLNPTISNPHWIYPGDLVRLVAKVVPPAAGTEPTAPEVIAKPVPQGTIELRQLAFVDADVHKGSGSIVGSPEEKFMLSEGDEVFLDYPEGSPPPLKTRYAIYTVKAQVKHPVTQAPVGAYVRLLGEVEVLEVKKGKRARGILVAASDVIERGQRVGVLKTKFRAVSPTPAETDLEGIVVAVLEDLQVIGQSQLIFVDRGTKDGVRAGNRLLLVRRGDAYTMQMGVHAAASRDDRRFPYDVIADVVVIDAGETVSLCLVTHAVREAEIGDHAILRKAK
jgi:hypothetical protein